MTETHKIILYTNYDKIIKYFMGESNLKDGRITDDFINGLRKKMFHSPVK